MDQFSVINDISPSILGITPVVLAAIVVSLALRYSGTLRPSLFDISTGTYLLAVGLAVLVMTSLFPFLRFSVHPAGGTDFYFARALNIIRYGVFGTGNSPSALFPPGYSFLLVPAALVLGESQWAFFLANISLLVGTSVAVRALLLKLGVREGHSNLAALLVILYPNRLLSTFLPFSDIPFSLLYLCSFLLMILAVERPDRKALPVAAWIVGGIAALVRATGVPLLVPVVIGLRCSSLGSSLSGRRSSERRYHIQRVALLLAGAALVLLPWSVRNLMLFGKVIPVSNNFGVNLAIGNNPGSGITHNGYIDSLARNPQEWALFGGNASWNEAQADSFLFRKGLEYIQEHPASFLMRGMGKVIHTLASDASSFGMHQTYDNFSTLAYRVAHEMGLGPSATAVAYAIYGTVYRFLFVLNNTFYYASFAFMLLLLVRHRWHWSGPELAYIFVIIIICGLVFVLFGSSRFKEPLPSLTLVLLFLQLANFSRSGGSTFLPSRREKQVDV